MKTLANHVKKLVKTNQELLPLYFNFMTFKNALELNPSGRSYGITSSFKHNSEKFTCCGLSKPLSRFRAELQE